MKYKQLLLSPLGLIPFGVPHADAADFPVKATAAPAITYSPSWAGWYAGVNLGVLSDRSHVDGFTPTGATVPGANYCFTGDCTATNSQTATGVLGGLQLGYNFEAGRVVYGLEADIDLSSARKTSTGTNVVGTGSGTWTMQSGIEALSTLRGRIGYAFDNTLLYATGGLAVAKTAHSYQGSTPVFGSGAYSWADAGWRAGYTVGAGLDYQLSRNWSVRGEGLYYDLGTKDLVSTGTNGGGFTSTFGARDRMNGWVARAGVNYLFH